MDAVSSVTGPLIPLPRTNVDTDQILPAQFLKRITKTGYEDALFFEWRKDPEFVLNRAEYAGGGILVAGSDFAIGSSREHAVWALKDFGIGAVLSPRFGPIFLGNAGKQGLVTGEVSEQDLERLLVLAEAEPGISATVDLVARDVSAGALRVGFSIDDYTRWRLLEGLDDIALTLRNEDAIAAFEAKRASWRPTTLPARTGEN